MLDKIKLYLDRLLTRDSFIRNVGILASGTAIAQAIPIAVSPILTRIYAPDEFGVVAVYLSCVAIISAVSTASYEFAITLPERDDDAANLVSLSLKLCVFVALCLYVPIVCWGKEIAQLLGNVGLESWLYLLPLSVIATGAFNVFNYWRNRLSQYQEMSINRIQNSALVSFFNVMIGLIQIKGGMILGTTIGQVIAASFIGKGVWERSKAVFTYNSYKQEKFLAKRYSNHPKHMAPSQLIGVAAQQIPVFMIGSLFMMATVGFFSMAYKLVSLPTALISRAIGDVYRQRISVIYNERGEFRDVFLQTFVKTASFAIVPFSALYFMSPILFELAFGATWRVAGEYAQILIVASFFQFIFTPLDMGAVITGITRYTLIWNIIRILALITLFIFAHFLGLSVEGVLWAFTVINSSLYIFDGIMQFRFSGGGYGGPHCQDSKQTNLS